MVPSGVMSVTSPIAFGRPAGGGERTKPTTLCVMVAPVGLASEIDCSCAYTCAQASCPRRALHGGRDERQWQRRTTRRVRCRETAAAQRWRSGPRRAVFMWVCAGCSIAVPHRILQVGAQRQRGGRADRGDRGGRCRVGVCPRDERAVGRDVEVAVRRLHRQPAVLGGPHCAARGARHLRVLGVVHDAVDDAKGGGQVDGEEHEDRDEEDPAGDEEE